MKRYVHRSQAHGAQVKLPWCHNCEPSKTAGANTTWPRNVARHQCRCASSPVIYGPHCPYCSNDPTHKITR
eukprot:scaffold64741_cov14-Prasinocladus_malaysianus.AAC.1